MDVGEFRAAWRASRPDFYVMAGTSAATLALGIELGIGVGVAASALLLARSSARPVDKTFPPYSKRASSYIF